MKQVGCMDLAGMIPDMVKNAMAKKQANGLKNLCAYAKDGTIPEQD